jgi:uncharacterized membrane protein
MSIPSLSGIDVANLIGPLWFVCSWVGYTLYADRLHGRRNLMQTMHAYRCVWVRRMLERDNRMVDAQIIANLMRSVSFFASTTLFILAGLAAVLGAKGDAMAVIRDLPFAVQSPPLLWDAKVMLLILVFAYGFFKFTWAFRHYNYCLILLGSVPQPDRLTQDSELIAERLATIATSSARHYNRGIRAYYFGLAALGWFIHPWLLVPFSAWVVLVLHRREFRSRLLKTLGLPEPPG